MGRRSQKVTRAFNTEWLKDFSSSPLRMKMAVVATVSALGEPWVFPRFDKPTLPANSAVGVATKADNFIRVS